MNPVLKFSNPLARIPKWSCASSEKWVLTAPTGWGKTLWLKEIALLREADKSEIIWKGKRVLPSDATAYRSQWIYVAQSAYRSPDTIFEHFSKIYRLKVHLPFATSGWLEKLQTALLSLGLEKLNIEKRTLQEISGGESQALSLIRSVLLNPQGLFLDEPTSAMDPSLMLKTENWIEQNYKGAWVWVTHDPVQAKRLLKPGVKQLGQN